MLFPGLDTLVKSVNNDNMGKGMTGLRLCHLGQWFEYEMENLGIKGTREDMRIRLYCMLDDGIESLELIGCCRRA